jgi:hypothetical protein
MTAQPDAWTEEFKLSLQRQNGPAVEFAGITQDITTFELGKKDIEAVAMANGGRRVTWTPQEVGTLSLKVIPLPGMEGNLSGGGVGQWFQPQAADDTSDPFAVSNTRKRNLHQVVLVWSTNLAGMVSAGSAVSAGEYARRYVIKNVYITDRKISADDKNLTEEIEMKWPPFDKNGSSNFTEDSGSAGLTVVTAFT